MTCLFLQNLVGYYKPFYRRENNFVAINPIAYLKESKAEFDKVIWPNRQETLRLTLVVLFISLVVGAYIVGLDAIFTTIVEKFLK